MRGHKQPPTEAALMALGKAGTATHIDPPFRQTNAFATNHPASPSKSAFADAVDLPKDSIDPISCIVDDKDGRNAKGVTV